MATSICRQSILILDGANVLGYMNEKVCIIALANMLG